MSDADKELRLNVAVDGGDSAAAALRQVAAGEKEVTDAAQGAGGSADGLTKIAEGERAVGDAAKASVPDLAAASDEVKKHGAHLGVTAREMQHTAESARVVADVIRGDMTGALIGGTNALKGITELLAKNPFLLAAIALSVAAEGFAKLRDAATGSAAEVKQREEEMAKNTETMAARMAEALAHPGQTKWAEAMIADFEKADAFEQKIIGTMERVYAASDKVNKALNQQLLSYLDMRENEDVRIAESQGQTPQQITQIKRTFQVQRDKLEAQGTTQDADAQVAAAQRTISNLQSELQTSKAKLTEAQRDIEERHAVSTIVIGGLRKQYEKTVADLRMEAEAKIKTGEENQNFLDTPVTEEWKKSIRKEAEKKVDDVTKTFTKQEDDYFAGIGQPKPEDSANMEALTQRINNLELEVDEAKLNLMAAQSNAITAAQKNSQSALTGLADADEDAIRAEASADAGRVRRSATTALKNPQYAGQKDVLLELQKIAAEAQADPTSAHMKDLLAEVNKLGSALLREKGKANANLLAVRAALQQIISRLDNDRE